MRDKYLSVTALTKYIKRKIDIDPHLKTVWIKGEVSNFKHHSSGHMYFTLKDNTSRIQSVMFAGNNRFLKFQVENGMQVLIKGHVSVFEPYGQYQLYVQQMEPDGLGALYLAYEQLKNKLEKQGLFQDRYKQPLPSFPSHIGIITSPTGAAVRDILTTIKRRYPIVKTTIIPSIVQGEQAARSIKQALECANELALFDVLILARGGGSIEDLWPFNEEIVAKAIFASSIPLISAIGHETDITISDFVADYRAPTPTGAAEIVVPSLRELKKHLSYLHRSLNQSINHIIQANEKNLTRLQQSYAFKYPKQLIEQKAQHLDLMSERLMHTQKLLIQQHEEQIKHFNHRLISINIPQMIEQKNEALQQLTKRLERTMNNIYQQKSNQLENMLEKLSLINPLSVMQRGYAIAYDETQTIIKQTKQVNVADEITVKISDGTLHCKVMQLKEDTNA
ncbi:MAG TPA: exodeoxyribonuclease VII large subunit [Bacillota bacterium]|nr:exodeoxyribonuclease VII large subunit [Bacillota bacterium]